MGDKTNNRQAAELAATNLHQLLENVRMAGFGEYFDDQICREVVSGKERFSVGRTLQFGEDKMEYKLDIRVDRHTQKGYLNDMEGALTEKTGVQRSQLFPRFLRITAREAYNLLKWGVSSGVEKSLFNREGVKYRSFITLDINGGKDLYGSYPLMQYHENYYREPFTIEGALRRLPVLIKEEKEEAWRLIVSLKRGTMTPVTAFIDGEEQAAYLSVNAKAGRLDLRGPDLKIIDFEVED